MTLAERLADFALNLTPATLPEVVRERVGLHVLDVLGVALAASRAECAPALGHALERWHAHGPCTVMGAKGQVPAPLAALANGTLAHSLDFDDTHGPSITHPSAVVVPAVLAAAEIADADGSRAELAIAVGYEALARLGMAAAGAFHARGWHATAVCGPFAAALAAATVFGLGRHELVAALGLAGSLASGVLEFLEDGSWAKRLHPGWAAQAGVVAASLAEGGFTGPTSILEGRFGFYQAFLGIRPDPDPFDTLGREWETLRIAIKPYPCCHYLHAFLECVLSLRRACGLDPAAVEHVECRVPPGEVEVVCEPAEAKRRPRSSYDARFSLPWAVAAALVDGRVGLDTFTPERLGDPGVSALAARVTYRVDPGLPFPGGFPAAVRIRLRSGRVLEAEAPDGPGGPRRPLPREAVVAKFRDNAGRVLEPARVAELERAALGLEGLGHVGALLAPCPG